jgi:hypothetical protein
MTEGSCALWCDRFAGRLVFGVELADGISHVLYGFGRHAPQ